MVEFYQALIGFPGPMELVIIMVIILVLFGGAKLPEMARNLGRGMRVFKEEANSLRREIEMADQPSKAPAAAKKSDVDAILQSPKNPPIDVKAEESNPKKA